jgi:hypothetical protein
VDADRIATTERFARLIRTAASVVLVLGLCACGDASIPGDPLGTGSTYVWAGAPGASGPTPPSSAQPLFDQNVAPILTATCSGAECHSAPGTSPIRFIPPSGTDAYGTALVYADRLVAGTFAKSNAQVLTRIANGHYTATYTAQDITLIEEWLDAEVAARVDMPGTPSVTRRMMSEMSGCMSLEDWNADGVAGAWALKETDEGPCQQCHMNGQGWLASLDSNRVFAILTGPSVNPANGKLMMDMYFGADLSDPATPKLIINRDLLRRAGEGNAQHPLFDIEGDAMLRLQRFYAKTVIRRSSFQCDYPRFEP